MRIGLFINSTKIQRSKEISAEPLLLQDVLFASRNSVRQQRFLASLAYLLFSHNTQSASNAMVCVACSYNENEQTALYIL